MPVFPGGQVSLDQYIASHLWYPAQAKKEKIAGAVSVCFMVDPEGNVRRAEVVKARHPLLDAEALRVISTLPAWKPGRHNGRLVPVSIIVPVRFILN
ncbi:energy transducer TonB [Hymenobacter cellulosivorans]|uniref:energy transducer TonB n=1 Tax=Hymenobacter cellulosivorans TaxID=2932249 RepID=UPI0035C9B7A4